MSPVPIKTTTTPVPTPTPTPAPGPLQSPTVVTVAGQDAGGVDVNVESPALATQVNAELLGVSPIGQSGSATNGGAQVHRGASMRVIVFGRALDGSVGVTIGGPQDISVSNIVGVTSTTGKPGVAFDITVSASAALGGRTVYLQATNNDVTAFTGGLEVLP